MIRTISHTLTALTPTVRSCGYATVSWPVIASDVQCAVLFNRTNVCSPRSLLPLRDLEFDRGPFLKALEAVTLDVTRMNEDILCTVRRRNETEPLGLVEPFYRALHSFDLCYVRTTDRAG